MTLLAGFAVQLLHIALMAAAAPTLVGVLRWMQARLAGRVGPSPLQPWREMIRLLRKQTVLTESASSVTSCGPAANAAATAVAAALVPSFALGMTFAPFADLLAIAGLLTAARCSLALAAMDAGTALGGVGASRAMLLASLLEPALLLVLFALALFAGSLNLDLIAATQMENGADWRVGVGIALGATLLVALADTMRHEALASDLAGRSLALTEFTDGLRLLVWFDLIGAMFLPFGMARSGAGPIAWTVGLTAWLGRTLLFAALLALLHAVRGHISLPRAAQMVGVAALLGLLAVVFMFADMGTT
jgi:formate hydrogenlyase subunit 4